MSVTLHDIQLYLKKFHHFLKEKKHIDIPYEFILSISIIRNKKVFPPITTEDLQNIISQIDRNSSVGKRDLAIILLAARTGIRGIDLVNVDLTDINWKTKEIRISQSKTGTCVVLPLLDEVCSALKDYILHGRPESQSPRIFLRAVRPYRPMQSSVALQHMWRGYQKKAGIDYVSYDGHGFHRSFKSFNDTCLCLCRYRNETQSNRPGYR